MDDVELAMSAGLEVGRLYKEGKSLIEESPILALSFLRGFAVAYCNALDRDSQGHNLSEKIKNLNLNQDIDYRCRKLLKTLQINGNKAAHPESYEFINLNFLELAKESLDSARLLIEQFLLLRDGCIPSYEITPTQSGAIKDIFIKAILERDFPSMYLAGAYLLERADKEPKVAFLNEYGYASSASFDVEQAILWLKQAADNEYPSAQYKYGLYLTQHVGRDEKILYRGERYISRAARNKNADALFYEGSASLVGTTYFEKNEVYARKILEEAAKLEHPGALAQLAAIYHHGLGGDVDKKAAVELTLRAADSGNPHAQFNLFTMYRNGDIIDKNELTAIKNLQDSADQNYPEAIYVLAELIATGQIPGRSPEDSIEEYKRVFNINEFRSRCALYIAKIIESCRTKIVDLLEAAAYLQTCYSLVVVDDPYQIKTECLRLCKIVLKRIREHVNSNGLDPNLENSEIFTSMLFDNNCIPVVDKEKRISDVLSMLTKNQTTSDLISNVNIFIKEACLKPINNNFSQDKKYITKLQNIEVNSFIRRPIHISSSVGRNDPCPCGSGKKFKKCHGS